MKYIYVKKLSLLLLCLLLCSGCYSTSGSTILETSSVDSENASVLIPIVEADEEHVPSGIIAESGSLSLEWDSDRLALLLRDQNGSTWGSLPLNQYDNRDLGGGAKRYVESHLVIDYIEPQTLIIKTVTSYSGANEYGRVYSTAIEKGIRITYYFDELGIVIPVEYTLTDGALQASIDVGGIHEDIYKVLRISLLPFCASTQNNSNDYILLPDGCGMLMDCDPAKGVRKYWSTIYGRDAASVAYMNNRNTAVARLPVFGIKSGNSALCGIITEGDGAAEINAVSGEPDITYSNVYASFYIRGSDEVLIPDLYGKKQIIPKFSENMLMTERLTVRYYPLSPKKNSYAAMADCYRNYLIKYKDLTKQNNDKLLYYDVLMAADIRKFYFGFPADVTTAITDYDSVNDILSQTLNDSGIAPVVRLSGIQEGGLEINKIGGGFRFENAVGSNKSYESLLHMADEYGISLYPDFDIMRFRQSKGSFNKLAAIKTPTTMIAYQPIYNLATKEQDSSYNRYMLLTPSKLKLAAEKTIAYLQKENAKNVSFSTLGQISYSDYRNREYYLRNNFSDIIEDIQHMVSDNGIGLMVEQANSYAAVGASHILSSPTETSSIFGEDERIPFYQMVFKGYISMSAKSLNLQDNSEEELLKSFSTGIGLLYTIHEQNTLDYVFSSHSELFSGEYNLIKNDINQTVRRFDPVFKKTQNAGITDYIKLDTGVYKTLFDNGVSIIVNYTENNYNNNGTKVLPMDFVMMTGGES